MTAQLFEGTLSQADPARSMPCMSITSRPPELSPELSIDALQEEWQIRFQTLQEFVCQLLIKNQQLRMALMEAKAKEAKRDDEGSE